MSAVRVGVLRFPGSLDERDAMRAVRLAGATPVLLWHKDTDLQGVSAVIVPGGFSYGDYLRAGAIARFAPVMSALVQEARKGLPVLGICNGFQVLAESHLLPGALMRNEHQRFICSDQSLVVENTNTPFTGGFSAGQRIVLPLKNGEGRFCADGDTVARLEDNAQVVFRYDQSNPNGSLANIAGICNERGNVVGLMPHPEHAVEPGFGTQLVRSGATRSGIDGLEFFSSLVDSILGS